MTSKNNSNKDFQRKVDKIVAFRSKKEKHEFQIIAFHLDIMNKIKCEMDKQGLTQKDLAKKLKVSKSYVSQLFSGDKILNLSMINDIKNVLGCTINFDLQFPIQPVKVNKATLKSYMEKRKKSSSFEIPTADYTGFTIKTKPETGKDEPQL